VRIKVEMIVLAETVAQRRTQMLSSKSSIAG
jgi:hypothetical protein